MPIDIFQKHLNKVLIITFLCLSISYLPLASYALNETQGEDLFQNNCASCHIKGGNIIRRNKTLKLKDLKRNHLDSPEAIAKIALEGIGIMSGYKKNLDDGQEEILAHWIWEQSQKAWIQE